MDTQSHHSRTSFDPAVAWQQLLTEIQDKMAQLTLIVLQHPPVSMPLPVNTYWSDCAKVIEHNLVAVTEFMQQVEAAPHQVMQAWQQMLQRIMWQSLTLGRDANEKIAELQFLQQQWLDLTHPDNYFATNAELVHVTIEQQGANLLRGMNRWLDDLIYNQGFISVANTDRHAFTIGENLAATPGTVVYRNDLMELLHYAPTCDKVYPTPVLITPPWINKYYILDLDPKKSLVRWLVDQGHTVFMISWNNPDPSFSHIQFEDYMHQGPIAAMDAMSRLYGIEQLNLTGYCIGGTLLACTLAYLAKHQETRIRRASFLTTLVDFTEPGELGTFLTNRQVTALELLMETRGYLDGRLLNQAFNALRAKDLIWDPAVDYYLMGKDPKPFNLLYWAQDATHMPAAMMSYYLRNMYQNNALIQPNQLVFDNTPLDLGAIDVPCFFMATEKDHITPWRSVYAGLQHFNTDVTFVLSGSGHVAGVTNHPGREKYGHHTGGPPTAQADTWKASATQHVGSWWPRWQAWLSQEEAQTAAPLVPAGSGLGAAPGEYVAKPLYVPSFKQSLRGAMETGSAVRVGD